MNLPDVTNGLFEFIGGLMNLTNVSALVKDKQVRGVRVLPTLFFTGWGFWNLYYYPHLHQWVSFVGGILIVGANFAWTVLAIYYGTRKVRLQREGSETAR